jgi:ribosomal protein L37AE/L43A
MSRVIQTKYRSVTFRSRLEARWAMLFDELGWPWEYEPIDLDGYIPDFVLPFKAGPLLVEVKPDFYLSELEQHTGKIENSGWEHEAMVVGASPGLINAHGVVYSQTIGLLAERLQVEDVKSYAWSTALFHHCSECSGHALHSESGDWRCRVCGAYDGNTYMLPSDIDLQQVWAETGGRTQWKP